MKNKKHLLFLLILLINQISYGQGNVEVNTNSKARVFINLEGVPNLWSSNDVGTISGVRGLSLNYENNSNIYSFGYYYGANKYESDGWFGRAKAENYNYSNIIRFGYGRSVLKNKLVRIIPSAHFCFDSGKTRLGYNGNKNKWEAEQYSSFGFFSELSIMSKRKGLFSIGIAPFYYKNSISDKAGIKFILSVNID